jgi:hypothetical protein
MARLMTEDVRQITVVGFLRGLRIAILALTAITLFGLGLPTLLPRLDAPPGPVVQVAVFLMLVGIDVVDAVLASRDRSWGAARWVVIALLLATYLVCTMALPAGAVFTVDNWYFNMIGWFGVLLLFDRPLGWFLIFLLAYVAITAAHPLLHGGFGRADLVGLTITTVSVGGFQTLTASAALALRRVASSAAAAAEEAERTRTGRAVARRTHSDRRRRYREVAATAGPLLSGLANGSLDPANGEVVRACALEAARMRRLFAENDERGDRLLHEVRACVDVAERRGVPVDVVSQGNWPELPREVRRALTDGPMRILSAALPAAGPARVTVIGTPNAVSVSVLARTDTRTTEIAETNSVRTTSISEGDTTWVEATWRAAP